MPSRSWFSSQLLPWYREHRRPLPWRDTRDPYAIWLSEVILQQTRVEQGRAYWERFMATYPTVGELAAATEDAVLKLWQGLGYYSRARNLLTAARQVAARPGPAFPSTYNELLQLKGVGDYTAAAIASISFDEPQAVVDGNVYRVLARFSGIDIPIDSTAGRKHFRALAQELLDPRHPGDHNQAVMELGATICTPKNYACLLCPLQERCVALATGRIEGLPVKQGVARTRDRFFHYLHIASSTHIHLQQRTRKDIWQGLFELPLIESEARTDQRAFARMLADSFGKGWSILSRSEEVKHVLSHQIIHAVFWEVLPPARFRAPKEWIPVPVEKVDTYAVPRLMEKWLSDRELGR